MSIGMALLSTAHRSGWGPRMLVLLLCLSICQWEIRRTEAVEFDIGLLEGHPPIKSNSTKEELLQRDVMDYLEFGCLRNANDPGNAPPNKWSAMNVNKSEAYASPDFVNGTTFWINEHMAVGHLMYDIAIIQVLQSIKIDRIVLQRAPCTNMNLCTGLGTFDGFYKGYYTAVIDAFQPGVPLYVRFTWQEKNVKPMYLTSIASVRDGTLLVKEEKRAPNFYLSPSKCFERLVRKNTRCKTCFYGTLSADAVQQFKRVSYGLVRGTAAAAAPIAAVAGGSTIAASPSSSSLPSSPPIINLPHHFEKGKPLVVTFAYRGPFASRHIDNVEFVESYLRKAFESKPEIFRSVELRCVNTSNDNRPYADQIRLVAESNVIITEHGAFQSNMVYLRNGSLLIDLRGAYGHAEYKNFENFARMFGVFFKSVETSGLRYHAQDEFNVTSDELLQIVGIVSDYIEQRPFSFNEYSATESANRIKANSQVLEELQNFNAKAVSHLVDGPISTLPANDEKAAAPNFEMHLLQGYPIVPEKAPMDFLTKHPPVIDKLDWGCLTNTQAHGHSSNKWFDLPWERVEAPSHSEYLPGVTFWVNEHMSVGHMMYDIALIQVLQSTHIDRIVLQRAPCAVPGLCGGIGTFDSFYQGLYISAIDAFTGGGIPIYIRWTWQEKDAKPVYVSSKTNDGYLSKTEIAEKHSDDKPFIHLEPNMCFETLIRRNTRCNSCFYSGVSASAVQKFKSVAYSLVRDTAEPLPHHFIKNAPIVVTHCYRGPHASRHINNIPEMQKFLSAAFPAPKFEFRSINTSVDTRGYAEQIRMVAEANIIITEHGAFQSNLIYMRNASLMVDLRGAYGHGEYSNFENLARMFGVFFQSVSTSGLTSHHDDEFSITTAELQAVVDKIKVYVEKQPFAFNIK